MAHPLVDFGYLNQAQFDELAEYSAPKPDGGLRDRQGFVDYAKELCETNVPLYHVLFLDKSPMPHMVDIWDEIKDDNRTLLRVARSHSKTDLGVIADGMHNLYFGSDDDSSVELMNTLGIFENSLMGEKTMSSILLEIERGGPNGLLGMAFPDFKKKIVKKTQNILWLESNKASRDPTFEVVGMGGSITGGHPERILGDDLVSYKNSETPHLRNRSWKWWTTTPEGMADPQTFIRLTHTPKFGDDLHMRLENTGKYNLIKKPALNRMPTREDFEPVTDDKGRRIWVKLTKRGLEGDESEGIEPLRALWPCPKGECPGPLCAGGKTPGIPLHRSAEYLIHDKFLNDETAISFIQEFMLEIRSEEDIVIQPDMLRFWSNDPSKWGKTTNWNDHPIVPFPSKSDVEVVAQAWDHAISDRAKADYTAMATAYRTSENDVFLKVRAGKWDFPTVKRMMVSHYETEPIKRPQAVVTEDIGFQKAFGQEVIKEGSSIVPIVPLSQLGFRRGAGKLDSMVETGYLTGLSNGQIYLQVEDTDTINEHLAFTGGKNQGMHDDRVDACRMAWAYIRSRIGRKARVYRPRVKRGNRYV